MSDVAAFVLARLDEDEQVARAAYDAPWRQDDCHVWAAKDDDPEEGPTVYVDGGVHWNQRATASHIARHDPARVLADVAAKRAIVELHNDVHECPAEPGDRYDPVWPVGWERESMTPCPTLRLLAQPYADHEDFDPAWTVAT